MRPSLKAAAVLLVVSAATLAKAQDTLALWRAEPHTFVRQVFSAEPDAWQLKGLEGLPTNPRTAYSACKGPGKTTKLAWSGWWKMLCFRDAQGGALSITGDNLRDNLWKELAYWRARSPIIQAAFDQHSERITSRESPETWFLSARSFPKSANADEQSNALAGLHGPAPFWLLDEIGDMDPGVISAAKGIFATKGQAATIVAAGNPTSLDGALYWLTATDSAQWRIIYITGDPDDPDRSPRIDIDWARAEIAALGRDNPWVMVNILGRFPPKGANQLIGVNDVAAAMSRKAGVLDYAGDPWVWGLDPARSEAAGADEASLSRRKGIMTMPFLTWRGQTGPALADQVMFLLGEAEKNGEKPSKIFVDVGGVGTSAYDHLVHMQLGNLVTAVDFGGKAVHEKHFDKRTEMWADMADWIKGRPACLPEDPVLRGELVSPRYEYRRVSHRTCFKLESKDEMKKRGVRSPNRADALALTFAHPVVVETPFTVRHRHQAITMLSSGRDPLGRG